MVALKAAQAAGFVKSPPTDCHAALVYGTDAGLVAERASSIARAFAARTTPAGEVIRIDDSDLEDNPDRLIVELQTVSMFGDSKVVRTALGRRINGAVLKGVLDGGPPAARLVVEGGNIKASDAARKIFEATSWAAALPCYGDSERDLGQIIGEMVTQAGRRIGKDAQDLLQSRLGADRALSRGEIEKLLLYVGDREDITIDDIVAVVGDASELAIDNIIMNTAGGRPAIAVRELDRSVAAGDSPQLIITALQRHFRRLHRLRSAMDAGRTFDVAARAMRPPIFYKHKDAIAAQCRMWPAERLLSAMSRIAQTAERARVQSAIDQVLAERLVLELSTMANAGRRR